MKTGQITRIYHQLPCINSLPYLTDLSSPGPDSLDNISRYESVVEMPHDNSVAESPLITDSEETLEQSYSQAQDTIESAEVRQQDITTSSSPKGKEYLDHTLQFLSTASNETLGACLAGLGAATYFILGRIGLVLIGLVGGVALHAIWEERNSQSGNQAESAEAKAKRRREEGLSILHRVLEWRNEDDTRQSEVNGDFNAVGFKPSALKQLNFSELEPATGAALTGLTDAVIRDYVKYMLFISFVERD